MTDCPRCGCPAFGFSSCYGHLKARLLSGESLTSSERAFVGFTEPNGRRDGWHSVTPTDLERLGDGWSSDLRGVRYLLELGDMRLELST